MKDRTLPDKFGRLADELNAELIERHEEVQCALLALVSGTTFFLLGPPGAAKSLLVRRLALRVEGAEFFDHAMDKFTVPDDIFGPRSLRAMKEDSWERAIDGTLVTADFAMLDEFFEASSALLKALLRALNERTFRQGSEVIPMRLSTVFTASNEVPTEPRLAALYDRLLIRRQARPVRETSGFVSMLKLQLPERPEPVLSWADVVTAKHAAARVKVPDRLLGACAQVRAALAEEGLHPSDRRFVEALKVVRAAAWLDGVSVAEPTHLRVLYDILWDDPSQRDVAAQAIDSVLEPLLSELDVLLRDVEMVRRQVRAGLPEPERKALGNELYKKMKAAEADLARLSAEVDTSSQRQRVRLERVREAAKDASMAIMRDLFEIEVENVGP